MMYRGLVCRLSALRRFLTFYCQDSRQRMMTIDKQFFSEFACSVVDTLDKFTSRELFRIIKLDYLQRVLENFDVDESIVGLVHQAFGFFLNIDQANQGSLECGETAHIRSGRPVFDVKEEQVSFLLEQGFEVPVITYKYR